MKRKTIYTLLLQVMLQRIKKDIESDTYSSQIYRDRKQNGGCQGNGKIEAV